MRPLLTVFGDLAFIKPKLVLMRQYTIDYFRIEDLLRWARYDVKQGPPEIQMKLTDPAYWSDMDGDGKILIRSAPHDEIEYAEVGSVYWKENR